MINSVKPEMAEYRLIHEPECFADLDTGLISEIYTFDGSDIGFLAGEEAVVFEVFALRFIKDSDEALLHAYLEVTDVPVRLFRIIAAVTGMPQETAALPNEGKLSVRFELRPGPVETMATAFEEAPTFSSFLSATDDQGEAILWNFANYTTESLEMV